MTIRDDNAYDEWQDRRLQEIEEREVNREEMERLSEQGCNSWASQEDFDRELAKSVEGGDLFKAKFLLNKGADPNGAWQRNADEEADEGNDHVSLIERLNLCSHSVRLAMLDTLVSSGLDLSKCAVGDTNDPAIMERLIDEGASIDTEYSSSPLHTVAGWSSGDFERDHSRDLRIVQKLIDAGCDVNAAHRENGETPLHYAGTEVAKLLIKAGSDVNSVSSVDGTTPLFRASKDKAQVLVEAGANVNSTDHRGNTPLHSAGSYVNNGQRGVEVFELLLAAGADTTHENKHGQTAFDVAGPKALREMGLKTELIDLSRVPGPDEEAWLNIRAAEDPQSRNANVRNRSEGIGDVYDANYQGISVRLSDDIDERNAFIEYAASNKGSELIALAAVAKEETELDDWQIKTTTTAVDRSAISTLSDYALNPPPEMIASYQAAQLSKILASSGSWSPSQADAEALSPAARQDHASQDAQVQQRSRRL